MVLPSFTNAQASNPEGSEVSIDDGSSELLVEDGSTLNLPSTQSSSGYSVDYGTMIRTPFDNRVVSELTEDDFPTVGPVF